MGGPYQGKRAPGAAARSCLVEGGAVLAARRPAARRGPVRRLSAPSSTYRSGGGEGLFDQCPEPVLVGDGDQGGPGRSSSGARSGGRWSSRAPGWPRRQPPPGNPATRPSSSHLLPPAGPRVAPPGRPRRAPLGKGDLTARHHGDARRPRHAGRAWQRPQKQSSVLALYFSGGAGALPAGLSGAGRGGRRGHATRRRGGRRASGPGCQAAGPASGGGGRREARFPPTAEGPPRHRSAPPAGRRTPGSTGAVSADAAEDEPPAPAALGRESVPLRPGPAPLARVRAVGPTEGAAFGRVPGDDQSSASASTSARCRARWSDGRVGCGKRSRPPGFPPPRGSADGRRGLLFLRAGHGHLVVAPFEAEVARQAAASAAHVRRRAPRAARRQRSVGVAQDGVLVAVRLPRPRGRPRMRRACQLRGELLAAAPCEGRTAPAPLPGTGVVRQQLGERRCAGRRRSDGSRPTTGQPGGEARGPRTPRVRRMARRGVVELAGGDPGEPAAHPPRASTTRRPTPASEYGPRRRVPPTGEVVGEGVGPAGRTGPAAAACPGRGAARRTTAGTSPPRSSGSVPLGAIPASPASPSAASGRRPRAPRSRTRRDPQRRRRAVRQRQPAHRVVRGGRGRPAVVVVEELRLVGGHVHPDRAVAAAALARQAQVEGVPDLRPTASRR